MIALTGRSIIILATPLIRRTPLTAHHQSLTLRAIMQRSTLAHSVRSLSLRYSTRQLSTIQLRDSAFPSSSAFSRVSVTADKHVQTVSAGSSDAAIAQSSAPVAAAAVAKKAAGQNGGVALLNSIGHSSFHQDISALLTDPLHRFHAAPGSAMVAAEAVVAVAEDARNGVAAIALATPTQTGAPAVAKVLIDEEAAMTSRFRLLARMLSSATSTSSSPSSLAAGAKGLRKVTAEQWPIFGEATALLARQRQRRQQRQTHRQQLQLQDGTTVAAAVVVRAIPEARDIAAVGGFGSRDLGVARRIELAL